MKNLTAVLAIFGCVMVSGLGWAAPAPIPTPAQVVQATSRLIFGDTVEASASYRGISAQGRVCQVVINRVMDTRGKTHAISAYAGELDGPISAAVLSTQSEMADTIRLVATKPWTVDMVVDYFGMGKFPTRMSVEYDPSTIYAWNRVKAIRIDMNGTGKYKKSYTCSKLSRYQ